MTSLGFFWHLNVFAIVLSIGLLLCRMGGLLPPIKNLKKNTLVLNNNFATNLIETFCDPNDRAMFHRMLLAIIVHFISVINFTVRAFESVGFPQHSVQQVHLELIAFSSSFL